MKTDKGVSRDGLHGSYLEDIAKVPAHDGTPLKLGKRLDKKALTKAGRSLTRRCRQSAMR